MPSRFAHAFALLIASALVCGAVLPALAQETINQQALKADLLVVTAHPDDESMMAGAMARYADQGKVVALASCTRGEGGGNGTGKESGAALGTVRELELRKCLAILGTRHLYFLDRNDFGYTESVHATLAEWGHDESLMRLVRLVRLLRPDVIATMDPTPTGGQHGHHQAAGRLATEAFESSADPDIFPQLAREEGLAPWCVGKLYWCSFGGPSTVEIATDGQVMGALATTASGQSIAEVTRAALRHHRSQGFDKFLSSPADSAPPPAWPSRFLLVKSRVMANPLEEKDLFDGITDSRPNTTGAKHDVLAAALGPKDSPVPLTARLRARDNVESYRDWLAANGIARLTTLLRPPTVTGVAGRGDNRMEVVIKNHTAERRSGIVSLEVPAPLTVAESQRLFDVPALGTATIGFQVTVPLNASVGVHDMSVRLGTTTDASKVDIVPSLTMTRLTAALPIDGDITKWQQIGAVAVPIPHTNIVQGRIAGPEECSGRFFVAHDEAGLQVLVDVIDDTVASNIAADDIKAHWRSTSVEICVDPKPPSEDTRTAFKLGVFPQDAAGHVRAARDADAHPGELGRLGSKIRLASRLTPSGYIIEAHMPWSELGFNQDYTPREGDALGFNIILYHAGKKDARPGEDIGKARLAWSYWPGVPGRPEVWGMAFVPRN